ncbi:MAG: hypothetical protein LBN29_01415 [Mediterranea sp.]|jgi:hypothetical protein|nr:hypothetical protein [Mediterranea sp.]
METQKPKIALYARRSFGERLNATFDFIKENWKLLLKYTTYAMLPLCLIQSVFMSRFANASDLFGPEFGQSVDWDPATVAAVIGYLGYMLFAFIASLALYSIVYALMQVYARRDERLVGITFNDLRPLGTRNAGRIIVMAIIVTFLVIMAAIVMAMLAFMSRWTIVFSLIAFIALTIPLALLPPIYLFEQVSIGEAIGKTYRLGFATWGSTFLMLLVLGIIGYALQFVLSLPYYAVIVAKTLLTGSYSESTDPSIGMRFLEYIFGTISLFGAYLASAMTIIGTAYQYGHATELVDSVTVVDDIDNFDQL